MMDRLFDAGALDVVFSPVQMKKNRPGVQIQVIGKPQDRDKLLDIIFMESTTLGVRYNFSQRKILERIQEELNSPWGKVAAKKVTGKDGSIVWHPEYEACKKIAMENSLSIREVYFRVMSSSSNFAKGDRD